MKNPISIIQDRWEEREEDRMDLMMRSIKAFRSVTSPEDHLDPEKLAHHRAEQEIFSKLVTPGLNTDETFFSVGDISCEWVKPQFAHRTDRVILYCHGGGYTCGGLGYAGILAGKMAQHTGLEVISFAYRLAPEHPYPAALEDAIRVWDYLMHLGYGAGNVILAGDSAGGNLALELCLELKKTKRFLPAGMILYSPWTDMRACSSSYKTYKDKDPLLTYDYVCMVRSAYAGPDADYGAPEFSPLLADLKGMPPALIQVGSNEILRRDSEKLAKNLMEQGCRAVLEVYKGGWHVFQQMPTPKSAHAMEQVRLFLEGIQ